MRPGLHQPCPNLVHAAAFLMPPFFSRGLSGEDRCKADASKSWFLRACPISRNPIVVTPLRLAVAATLLAGTACPAPATAQTYRRPPPGSPMTGFTAVQRADGASSIPIIARRRCSSAPGYKTGSRDEPPGKTGFAHLFEHLMFQTASPPLAGVHGCTESDRRGRRERRHPHRRHRLFRNRADQRAGHRAVARIRSHGLSRRRITQALLDEQRASC